MLGTLTEGKGTKKKGRTNAGGKVTGEGAPYEKGGGGGAQDPNRKSGLPGKALLGEGKRGKGKNSNFRKERYPSMRKKKKMDLDEKSLESPTDRRKRDPRKGRRQKGEGLLPLKKKHTHEFKREGWDAAKEGRASDASQRRNKTSKTSSLRSYAYHPHN